METSARLLRLLSLLQSRPDWSGPELASRLDVTTRTVRRDVERLRHLGYPVDAAPGQTGGYRLGPGASLPPLLLEDEEATAVAVALSVSAGGAVRGIEEPALAALAKLDRLMPPRLRDRVAALKETTVRLMRTGDEVDADVLVTLAQASAGQERVVLAYRDREGVDSERRVEPHRLVATGRRWYLVAHDLDRRDWRTFRVDRIRSATRTGHRFRFESPPPDAAELVSRATAVAPYRWAARIVVDAPVDEVQRRVPPTVALVAPADDGRRALITTGAEDLDMLAGHLVSIGLPFEVLEPPELRELVRALGTRLARAHRTA